MDLTLTNQEWFNLFNVLSNVNITGSAKFTYIMSKNRGLIKPHIDALQAAAEEFTKNHPRLADYQKAGEELLRKHATGPDGKPQARQSPDGNSVQWIIPQDKMAGFVQDREALDKEYADVLVAMSVHQAAYLSLLKETTALRDIRTVKLSELPKDAMNTQYMNSIFVFVEDEPEPEKTEGDTKSIMRRVK